MKDACRDKRIAFIGDSFTARAQNPRLFSYIHPLTGMLGCHTLNYGVTGTGYVRQNGQTTFTQRVDLLPEDVDYVIVFGGVNDFGARDGIAEFELGRPEDGVGADSFYGQVRLTLEKLLIRYPAKKIAVFTPVRISSAALKAERGTLYGRDINSFGCTLKDYVDVLEELCRQYGISCCNLYENGGFNDTTIPIFTDDGLHPNEAGSQFLAERMADFMRKLCWDGGILYGTTTYKK